MWLQTEVSSSKSWDGSWYINDVQEGPLKQKLLSHWTYIVKVVVRPRRFCMVGDNRDCVRDQGLLT